jgi:hypothetical protein
MLNEEKVKTHTVIVRYTCGHIWTLNRVPGGVSDYTDCLCESCSPWDGEAQSVNECKGCGGTGMFFRSDVKPLRRINTYV